MHEDCLLFYYSIAELGHYIVSASFMLYCNRGMTCVSAHALACWSLCNCQMGCNARDEAYISQLPLQSGTVAMWDAGCHHSKQCRKIMSNAATMHASGPKTGPHRKYHRSRPRGVSSRASRMVAA